MRTIETPTRQEQRFRMSYDEFLRWSDEDTHAEWVNGQVTVFMPPKEVHQALISFLHALLALHVRFFDLGQLYTAPFEMRLPNGNAREPDLLFVAKANEGRITEDRLEGAADLVVEVVSKESVTRDRRDKLREYEAAGVREYWVLDPRPRQRRAEFWLLGEDGRYRAGTADEDGRYHATVVPGFWLQVAWLWAKEKPEPQLTFAEIANFPAEVVAALRQVARRGPG